MIVKPPSNKYEKQIYQIITESEEYQELSEGEKSIIYDFTIQHIPKYIPINWETINLNNYIKTIKDCYKKHSGLTILSSISNILNHLGYKTKIECGQLIFLD